MDKDTLKSLLNGSETSQEVSETKTTSIEIEWLRNDATSIYDYLLTIVPNHAGMNLFMLQVLADSILEYIELSRVIHEEGFIVEHTNKFGAVNRVPHPILTKKTQSFERIVKLLASFGLSPKDLAGQNDDLFGGRL